MEGRFMRRLTPVRLKVMLVLVLAIVVPEEAFRPAAMHGGQAPAPAPAPAAQPPAKPPPPVEIPLDLFKEPESFNVTLWAAATVLHNPKNNDIDRKDPIWVAEGVRYRQHYA